MRWLRAEAGLWPTRCGRMPAGSGGDVAFGKQVMSGRLELIKLDSYRLCELVFEALRGAIIHGRLQPGDA